MIQKTSLRIGNKLLAGSDIITVAELYEDEFETPEHGVCSYSHEQISGVPLSHEIVKHVGFKDYYGNDMALRLRFDDGLEFAVYDQDGWQMRYQTTKGGFLLRLPHVIYLHNLQNVFHSLRNSELEFKS